MTHTSKAIVLSLENFGEADRYVQFYTQKWGMISALAKSARKSKRRYVGGLDLFCHDEIFLRGDPKERPYLNELSVINSFAGIRDHLDRLLSAGKVAQWVRKLANTATPMPQIYSLIGQTLSLIEKEDSTERLELLNLIFRLKLLSELGFKPRVDRCAQCEEEVFSSALRFDLESGGVLCANCAKGTLRREYYFLQPEDRMLLHKVDLLRLTQWNEFVFPIERTRPLARLVTHFASFHNHVALPT
jgi:DNA repair protein RecO (recombination protein O)